MQPRPPFPVTPFYTPEEDLLGFEQVANVPGVVGVGAGQGAAADLPRLEVQQLIEQVDAPELVSGEGSFDPSLAVGLDTMRDRAEAMIAAGRDTSEIGHPLQALGRATQQIVGSYMMKKADERAAELQKQKQAEFKRVMQGDPGGVIDRMLASEDPEIVQRGLELWSQQVIAKNKKSDKPLMRDRYDGGETVQEQYNPETGKWEEYGRGPRFARQVPGISISNSGRGGDFGFEEGQDASNNPLLLDDETADFIAEQVMAGDRSAITNLGRGKAGAANIVKVRRAIARKAKEIDPATGKPRMTPRQVAAAEKELQGYGAYLRKTEQQAAAMRTAASEARAMMPDIRALSARVPRTAFSDLNWINNEFRARTGDPNIVAFAAALNSFINAYSRAIQPSGVPTVSDKEHARDMINTAMSQGQIEAALAIMDREMQNAIAAPGESRRQRKEEYYSGDTKTPHPAGPFEEDPRFNNDAETKSKYKDDDTKTIGGKKYVRKNGNWIEVK